MTGIRWGLGLSIVALVAISPTGCAQKAAEGQTEEVTLAVHSLDDLTGLAAGLPFEPDSEVTADGGGSLRLSVDGPVAVTLLEVGDVDVENAMLIYRARLRSEGLDGQAYLEMWCSFADVGEFFSRGVDSPISGTTDWCARETPFLLKAGQNPSGVRLGLVVDGTGTVWVDDIRLVKTALR